jgi:hypothetical protein
MAEAGTDVRRFAERVNCVDVILTVHGAGMTKNQIFLPTGPCWCRSEFVTRNRCRTCRSGMSSTTWLRRRRLI